MAKKKNSKNTQEQDSAYLLKMLLYLIVGSIWMYIEIGSFRIPLPIGGFLALAFASHEHFQIDRKIEYALILIALSAGYFLSVGIVLSL